MCVCGRGVRGKSKGNTVPLLLQVLVASTCSVRTFSSSLTPNKLINPDESAAWTHTDSMSSVQEILTSSGGNIDGRNA